MQNKYLLGRLVGQFAAPAHHSAGTVMGNEFYYRTTDNTLGDLAKGRWSEARRIVPLLVDYVNRSMHRSWEGTSALNVTVRSSGPSPCPRQHPSSTPEVRFIDADSLFADLSAITDEVYVVDAASLKVLFLWCDFLQSIDGAFAFYRPTVDALHQATRGVEEYW